MQETEAFIKYEKATTIMDITSKILAGVMFLTVLTSAILGFAFRDKIDFYVCFYVAAAAAAVFIFGALPLRLISERRKSTVDLCRSYLKVLGRSPKNAVDEIHEVFGIATQTIMDNFIKLEAMGFLDGVFIDKEHQVVNAGVVAETKEFECPACGGKTEVKNGEEEVCGFCGAIKEKEKD